MKNAYVVPELRVDKPENAKATKEQSVQEKGNQSFVSHSQDWDVLEIIRMNKFANVNRFVFALFFHGVFRVQEKGNQSFVSHSPGLGCFWRLFE
ncbi:hypothetical protein O5903_00665 [Escherichia coli]|nr:hypothetical protein [Escherichia coli]